MDKVTHRPIGGSMRRVPTAILVCLLPLVAQAAPPTVTFKDAEVKARKGTFVVLKADVTNGKGTTKYKLPASDNLSFLPSDLLADKSAIVFTPLEDGVYEFWAWAGNEDGASDLATVKVIVGTSPTKPPVTDPPKDPPVTPADVYYFAVVRQDQNTADFERLMNLPAWGELRAKGHVVNDIPVSKLDPKLKRPDTLPAVMVLKKTSGGLWQDTESNRPMPTTDEAIRGLLK